MTEEETAELEHIEQEIEGLIARLRQLVQDDPQPDRAIDAVHQNIDRLQARLTHLFAAAAQELANIPSHRNVKRS